jgi:hypothetical protein
MSGLTPNEENLCATAAVIETVRHSLTEFVTRIALTDNAHAAAEARTALKAFEFAASRVERDLALGLAARVDAKRGAGSE